MATPNDFFEWFFLAGFIIGSSIRAFSIIKFGSKREQQSFNFSIDTVFLTLVGIGMLIPVFYLFTSWFDFANYSKPLWLSWIGVPFMVTFWWLLYRSHKDLNKNWSPNVEILQQQTLVTEGVYRSIRHPMYAAHFLWAIAQILLLSNWIAGFSLLIPTTILYLYRVPREESMMLAHFGTAYHAYCKQTNRLIPNLK